MAPVAITSLAILAGMFVILDSRAADQRLVARRLGSRPARLRRLPRLTSAILTRGFSQPGSLARGRAAWLTCPACADIPGAAGPAVRLARPARMV
jgi:hypothetical protein